MHLVSVEVETLAACTDAVYFERLVISGILDQN
jgi:hypothetical protein